jgi:hypothetical protein
MRELINIGDKKLEVLIEGNGMPPVVILSGMGCTIDEWHYVIRALKDTTQLILPHRSGLGESELEMKQEQQAQLHWNLMHY